MRFVGHYRSWPRSHEVSDHETAANSGAARPKRAVCALRTRAGVSSKFAFAGRGSGEQSPKVAAAVFGAPRQ